MSADAIPVLSLLIALLSVIVGPLISLHIAKRQNETQLLIAENNIRSTVHSRNRQEWINSLRSTIAEFVSAIAFMRLQYQLDPTAKKEFLDCGRQVFLLGTQIELMLNPSEPDHSKLSAMLASIGNSYSDINDAQTEKAMLDAIAKLVPLSQTILKREWERVKALE